jgi:hypothetical protein
MIQDNDQKEAAQYNLAKQAMDIRKKSWMLKNRNR